MASILRSGKFVRYFSGIARNIVFNPQAANGKDAADGGFVRHSQALCAAGSLQHGFATIAVPKQPNPAAEAPLERSLRRLDSDVRRTGRITRHDLEEVLAEIRAHRSATSSQSLLVIRCCGNLVPEEPPATRTALVLEIWQTLQQLGVAMDVSHYNALLRVYLENEHAFSPAEFLADLERKGVEPNRVTYQRLISRYCQLGDIEGATRILEFMRERQLPINEHVFNALIMGHSQAGDLESARGILAVMQQAGLEPTADTYTTLLCAYAKRGDHAAIARTLDQAAGADLQLADRDLFDVIHTLATSGHAEHVAAVLPRLRRTAGYNQDAVNVILRLTSAGHEAVAFDILKTMPRGARADGQPTDTGAFFVRQLVRAGRPAEAVLAVCGELQASGMHRNALLVAVEAAVATGSVALAGPLMQRLRTDGQPIRQHYFWPLLCAQATAPASAAVEAEAATTQADRVLGVVRHMQHEFGQRVSGETVRDYVLPQLGERDGERAIALLRSAGVSVATAVTSVAHWLLQQGRLSEAAAVAAAYGVYYQPGLFRKLLVQALQQRPDEVEAFVRFVRAMHDSLPRLERIRRGEATVAAAGEDVEEEVEVDETIEADATTSAPPPSAAAAAAAFAEQAEVLGLICNDVAAALRRDRVPTLERILRALVEQGLSVSAAQAERLQERLGSELTATVSELLGRLAAGDLEPVQQQQQRRTGTGSYAHLSADQLEHLIGEQTSRPDGGSNVAGLKRLLLSALFRAGDVERTERTIERLTAEGFQLTGGARAQWIEQLALAGQPQRACEQFREQRERDPDFVLDDLKVVRVIGALVTGDGGETRLAEALRFAEENRREKRTSGDGDAAAAEERSPNTFHFNATVWRLLNGLADAGRAGDLRQLFDQLLSARLIEPNNVLLGPLVKVHLVLDDVQRACDVFEELCQRYQSTPWKNDLACRLIQTEDAANLQRLTDLSTSIHGEVNSLYDLVFAFVECGRVRQARKILETPGLRTRPHKLGVACERYREEGRVEPLEALVEATRDLGHIDRAAIFENLLISYEAAEEPQAEKALGLWTKMQEENIQPSERFLVRLGGFLRAQGREVPFAVPETEAADRQRPSKKQTKQPQSKQTTEKPAAAPAKPSKVAASPPAAAAEPKSPTLTAFKRLLRTGATLDIDATIAAHAAATAAGDTLSVTDRSVFVEALVNADRQQAADRCVDEMLAQRQFPMPRIFRFYLNRVAAAGDVERMERIGAAIGGDTKRLVSFDNRLCQAYEVAGRTEAYVRELGEQLERAQTAEERTAVAAKFPRGGAVGILEKHPELVEEYRTMADKYAAAGHLAPLNVLWMHQLIAGNAAEAERLWSEAGVRGAPQLMFQRIVHVAREQRNEPLVRDLLRTLRSAEHVTAGALGVVHSCLIDVLAAKGEFAAGAQAVEEALRDVRLEQINRTALLRVKEGVEQTGGRFAHAIPERAASRTGGVTSGVTSGNDVSSGSSSSSTSSSSSSSSDDEPPKTRRHDAPK